MRAMPVAFHEQAQPLRLLSPKQRQELSALATRVTVAPRGFFYREDSPAGFIFFCREGTARAFRDLPNGRRALVAFLFPDDIFGLAERGRYVNSVQAITAVACYRIPLEQLVGVLGQDAALGLQFLYKLTHELREAQRRAILLCRRSARGRVAMFLHMLETMRPSDSGRIALPMSRRDIADYAGLSFEAVSRATRRLSEDRIVEFTSSGDARILDRRRFDRLALDT